MILLKMGEWWVIHDAGDRSVYCCRRSCGELNWEHADFHTYPAKIHVGPVWRYGRWWQRRTVRGAYHAAVQWAEAQRDANQSLDAEDSKDSELLAVIQEARDQQEVQRILEEL